MALRDLEYIFRVEEQRPQQAVTFEVPNPDHDEYWEEWDPMMMREFYEAALWARDTLGKDRNPLVGHFLRAVQQMEEEDNPTELRELFDELTR